MIGITAILHTHNDALRIARAVESLRCCDEVLIIDHGSPDDTCGVARAFGARVIAATGHGKGNDWAKEAAHDWIFCMQPREVVSEGLEASLLEWKLEETPVQIAFSVGILEDLPEGWVRQPPETRLVHRNHASWDGWGPIADGKVDVLDACLTRLRLP